MKRWNGWGNVHTEYPLPPSALVYLSDIIGTPQAQPDASYEQVLRSVPASRVKASPRLDVSPKTRLVHARGQSLPDWVALCHGRVEVFPDGVAFPQTEQDVKDILEDARKEGACLIPYGGGTSVVGHINPLHSDRPVLTVSLEKMTRLLQLDEFGLTATFETGVTGPELEKVLGLNGYTLGHYPQSHEYSTLGGWIATRSSGQQSYRYGRIEQMFAGGRVETPQGRLELPHFPASAAGPDLKELLLGSEGRMGIITQAIVKVRPLPKAEEFLGIFFPSWEQGVEAVRSIAQQEIPVSMLRLSNPLETETTLILSGKSWIGTARKGLSLLGYGSQKCLLILGLTGSRVHVLRTRREAAQICHMFGGWMVGKIVGHTWEKSRFYSPYLRNTLWEQGVAIDTLETALPWSKVMKASDAIPASIVKAGEKFEEKVLAFTHLSHVYRDGASVYTTFLFRRLADPDSLLEFWKGLKQAASGIIQECGGTITHQHGVGTDHAPYLIAEKGELGMDAIRNAIKVFDPEGMMNPGKLF